MAVFKCKICCGDICAAEGASFGTCSFCGVTSTLPQVSDEKIANLFNRANHFRRLNEFDRAFTLYETILNENNANAEAHWCATLCRYGIEYVENPKTLKRVPTCHRVHYESILTDADYLAAIENASDTYTRNLYETEARKINDIQKGIIAVSLREDPFDVFICYKETAENGHRTKDSVYAQDIYYELAKAGYRAFFAKITLEDKLGHQYEPYIFGALNSAKVMLVIGTCKEYFESTWVKNEWGRYLALIKGDRSRLIIPCYCDMDAYEMPDELANLQALDMSKIGFLQDLVRGVKKVLEAEKEGELDQASQRQSPSDNNAAQGSSVSLDSLLKRGLMFLEDGDFEQAGRYFERVLDSAPEHARAYVGKLCAQLRVRSEEALPEQDHPIDDDPSFRKALRFADDAYKAVLNQYADTITQRLEERRQHEEAKIRETERLERERIEAEAEAIRQKKYDSGKGHLDGGYYNDAMAAFYELGEYRDSKELLEIARKKKSRRTQFILKIIFAACIVAFLLFQFNKLWTYNKALLLADQGRDEEAALSFIKLGNFKDSGDRLYEIYERQYDRAYDLLRSGELEKAALIFKTLGNFGDSAEHLRRIMTPIAAARVGIISSKDDHIVGLTPSGKVVTTGARLTENKTTNWQDIVFVAAGSSHVVGLRQDGTVVAAGYNVFGQCDVTEWRNIVAVAAGDYSTIGVCVDGSVVKKGLDQSWDEMDQWEDIVAVSANHTKVVGLKSDGSVVVVERQTNYTTSWAKTLSGWQDITAISVGDDHVAGLRSDGTVLAVGNNTYGQCYVAGWRNIVAISAGNYHTVGLKANGTVVAAADENWSYATLSSWRDIIAVAASTGYNNGYTLGLKADGSIVVTSNIRQKNDIAGWRLRTNPIVALNLTALA